MAWPRKRTIDWPPILARLTGAVIGEDGLSVDGTVDGIPVFVRFDPVDPSTTVEATRAIDDRFSLRLTPRPSGGDFEQAFVIHASPLDLPRLALDGDLRARLLAIDPRPTVQLERSRLELETARLLDPATTIAALEIVARLVRALDDRAVMCPR